MSLSKQSIEIIDSIYNHTVWSYIFAKNAKDEANNQQKIMLAGKVKGYMHVLSRLEERYKELNLITRRKILEREHIKLKRS